MLNLEKSIDTTTIYDLLQPKELGSIVTFEEIRAVCYNKDIDKLKSTIVRVVDKLRREGIIYHNERELGYRRVGSTKIVAKSPKFLRSARRKLIKSIYEINAVVDEELTNDDKIKKNTYFAHNSMILFMTRARQLKRIEQKVIAQTLSFDPLENLKYLSNS